MKNMILVIVAVFSIFSISHAYEDYERLLQESSWCGYESSVGVDIKASFSPKILRIEVSKGGIRLGKTDSYWALKGSNLIITSKTTGEKDKVGIKFMENTILLSSPEESPRGGMVLKDTTFEKCE